MTIGYPIFNGALEFQSWKKTTMNTYVLENQTMKSNHSTSVRENTTSQNTRKKKSMLDRMN